MALLFSGDMMTKELELTKGQIALVDDDIYIWATQWKWKAKHDRKTFYACRNTGTWPLQKTVYLHREIMAAPAGVHVDHINGDGLDCRRVNMRVGTDAENRRNRPRQANNASGFKGVSWRKREKKWVAQIQVGGKKFHIGHYDTPEAAARAYDVAARKYHGKFAKPNFGVGK